MDEPPRAVPNASCNNAAGADFGKRPAGPRPGAAGTPAPRLDAGVKPASGRRERVQKPRGASLSHPGDKHQGTTTTTARRTAEETAAAERRVQSPRLSGEKDDRRAASGGDMQKDAIISRLPPGVDESAARQIMNEIVIRGDEVHWDDVAGLEVAKTALREAVVYPFLRPDLFMGLREPTRGMLLFGPPGTGKTMLARAVATESKSTFFSISASSLTSKYLGESEKLVRALFALAKLLAPSIIFVDEIDSLLSQRSGSGEHEATRRIKTEFLIQWSDLERAAAGRDPPGDRDKDSRGDPNRVLVLAATNLPWAIDEAARRRFVRRQYIPLPEPKTRETQLRALLGRQMHSLSDADVRRLVDMTEGRQPLPAAHAMSSQPLTCSCHRVLRLRHHGAGEGRRHGAAQVAGGSALAHDHGRNKAHHI